MRRECVGQSPLGRQLRRKQAGAQQPDRHMGARPRHGDQLLARLDIAQQALQLGHIARKIVFRFVAVTAQGTHGHRIGPRRTAQAQVDAPGVELGQGAKGLGHHQRGMVGQHHAARTHTHALRTAGDVAHQHRRGGAGNAAHVVVFGQPVALEAQSLGVLCSAQGDGQRVGHRAAFAHGDQVEHGQANIFQGLHAPIVGLCAPVCCRRADGPSPGRPCHRCDGATATTRVGCRYP